jgi:hypothetical protein
MNESRSSVRVSINALIQRADALPQAIFCSGLGFYCVWTLGTTLVSLYALPFEALYVVLVFALGAAVLALHLSSAVGQLLAPRRLPLTCVSLATATLSSARERQMLVAMSGLAVLFIAALGTQYKLSLFLPLWLLYLLTALLALLCSGAAAGLIRLTECPTHERGMPTGPGTLLVVTAMLGFYFLTSVPDSDDALYLNFAVGALRGRHGVYAHDTMLGSPALNFIKSTYRLESYPLLAAMVADLTGIRVVVAAHAVVATLALVFAGAALVLLHRALLGTRWLFGVAAHLAFLIALDGALQSYGSHAIPRFFQGKAPFVTVMVPVMFVLTIVAVRDRSWLALTLTGMVIVASIGLTANALFAAPLAIILTAVPLFVLGNRLQRIACARLSIVLLYPAVLAGYLLRFDPPGPSEFTDPGTIGTMLWGLFGTPAALLSGLALLFLAAGAAVVSPVLRSVSLYVLVLLVLVLNPFLWDFYGQHVTGHLNYRLLWSVPIPLAFASLATVTWMSLPGGWRPVIAFGLVALTAVPGSVLQRVAWGPSLTKVPPMEYAAARAINSLTPDNGGLILAPETVAAWIPTLDEARPVVEARSIYLSQRLSMSPDEHQLRQRLFDWVSGRARCDAREASSALKALDVETIAIRDDDKSEAAREQLAGISNYGVAARIGEYIVYARK